MSVTEMLDKAKEALRRDLNHIFTQSSNGKLAPAAARDLAVYIKVLHELEEREKEFLDSLTEEELKALNETK